MEEMSMRGQNHSNNRQMNQNGYSLRGEQTAYHRYPQPPYLPYQQPMPGNPYTHPAMQPYQMMPAKPGGTWTVSILLSDTRSRVFQSIHAAYI